MVHFWPFKVGADFFLSFSSLTYDIPACVSTSLWSRAETVFPAVTRSIVACYLVTLVIISERGSLVPRSSTVYPFINDNLAAKPDYRLINRLLKEFSYTQNNWVRFCTRQKKTPCPLKRGGPFTVTSSFESWLVVVVVAAAFFQSVYSNILNL